MTSICYLISIIIILAAGHDTSMETNLDIIDTQISDSIRTRFLKISGQIPYSEH